ncbi:hypothetical protein [Nocardioides flavescens]|uniref:WD40-like Beta Propeller Repeat n=1 Tax=Nocardioides flavescens TaxID=2691959 RepID=A0A6L7ET68_9ACTN|nr:hypothetical protein [Nocardioides flavescens]MXG88688.1 hypothetical protein [Nocardioides flavescens]
MDSRRRTVAALAAAATAASLALVTTAPAHAETRTTRLISTTTATGQNAYFEGGGGSSVWFSDPGGLWRNVNGAVSSVTTADVDVEQVSSDGTRAVVRTDKPLIAGDGDASFDLYLLDAGTVPASVTLISTAGSAGDVSLGAASPDLSRIVYQGTSAYVVANGSATILGGAGSDFQLASRDATAVVYTYNGSQRRDIGGQTTDVGTTPAVAISDDGLTGYVSNGGIIRRFTAPASAASATFTTISGNGSYNGSTPDGQSVFVATPDKLVSADTDTGTDVYRFDVGSAVPVLMTGAAVTTDVATEAITPSRSLVFTDGSGPARRLLRSDATGVARDLGTGVPGQPVFAAVTTTGAVVLTGYDTNELSTGTYLVDAAGALTQLSTGGYFAGSSPDGSKVWYFTAPSPYRVYESAVPVSPPSPPADTTTPTASAKAKKRQENDGRIEVQVTCTGTEACRVTGAGTLSVTVPATRGKRKFALTAPLTLLSPGQKAVVAFKVRKKAKKAAALALRRGGRAQAVLRIAVADTSGNTRALPVKVRLR